MKIPKDILSYYEKNREDQRKSKDALEFILVSHLILKLLPKPPATLLDLGAGAGFYSLLLARAGYQVVSIEPSQANLTEFKKSINQLRPEIREKIELHRGDHSWLDHAHLTFDGILLMGPLYHLFDPLDRQKLLSTAYLKLRPQGKLLATWLSRMGWLSYVFRGHPELAAQDPKQIGQILQHGEILHHPQNGDFRGKFDTISSVQDLFSESKVPLNELIAADPLGSILNHEFSALDEASQLAWSQFFLLAAQLPESLGAAKTWLTCSIKTAT